MLTQEDRKYIAKLIVILIISCLIIVPCSFAVVSLLITWLLQ